MRRASRRRAREFPEFHRARGGPFANRYGNCPWPHRAGPLLTAGAFPFPAAGPPVHHPEQAPGGDASAIRQRPQLGSGDKPSPVPTVPSTLPGSRAYPAPGSAYRPPSTPPAAPRRPPASPWPRAPAGKPPRRCPAVPPGGSGPSAFRQSPSARSDAARHGRAHGIPARSPASARTASRRPASGISIIKTTARIMNALVSSRSRLPFTNRGSSTARSAISSIAPGPAQSSSHFSSGPSLACPAGLPAAWTFPSRRTNRHARDRHHLAEHRPLTRPDPLRPPDDQRRQPTSHRQRAVPQRRRHIRQPDRDHQPVLREHVTGTGHDRVQRHKRLLWTKKDLDNLSSRGASPVHPKQPQHATSQRQSPKVTKQETSHTPLRP